MSKAWVVDDELWELIEPVLPPWPQRAPGPRPVPDRLCLQGILFVPHAGIGWGGPAAGARLRFRDDLLAKVAAVD